MLLLMGVKLVLQRPRRMLTKETVSWRRGEAKGVLLLLLRQLNKSEKNNKMLINTQKSSINCGRNCGRCCFAD